MYVCSHALHTSQLVGSAYADSINYMNTLRIKEGMLRTEGTLGNGPSNDPMTPRFGESWQVCVGCVCRV